jgi:hypothetical protein
MMGTSSEPEIIPKRTEGSREQHLPPFGKTFSGAVAVNGLLIAVLLISGRVKPALSIFVGLLVGAAIYGTLHLFIEHALDAFVGDRRGTASKAPAAQAAVFSGLLVVKYIVLGVVLFFLLRSALINVLWVLGGFVITQVCVTIKAVNGTRAAARKA